MKHVLTIAGSDSGGGAGVQADLKTMVDHGCFGMSVITAITAQSPRRVSLVEMVSVKAVAEQLRVVLTDLPVDAVKIGMVGSEEVVVAIATELERLPSCPPVVLDPVMVSTSGASLMRLQARQALLERLVPLAAVITPNQVEAELLESMGDLHLWCKRSHTAVLVTGGDASGDQVIDTLVYQGRERVFRGERLKGGPWHGTGCTLSSALACNLALGYGLEESIERAMSYLRGLIREATSKQLPHGAGSKV